MPSSLTTANNLPRAQKRSWVWLLLTLWLLAQSLAWVHRVEHGVQLRGNSAHASFTSDAVKAADLHAGIDCEWLDHALLAGFAGAATHVAPLSHFAASSPIKLLPTLVNRQQERPYLARAPPVQPHIFEGRVTG